MNMSLKLPSMSSWEGVAMRVALSIAIIGAAVGGCSYINGKLGLKDDHPLEEAIEAQINNQLGVDVDLSGGSKEEVCSSGGSAASAG